MKIIITEKFYGLSKEKFYLSSRRYIESGYRIKEVTKEKGLYVEAVYIYVGFYDPNIYIEKRYLESSGKDKIQLKEREKQGYIICADEWYDEEETNIYVMVKELNLFVITK